MTEDWEGELTELIKSKEWVNSTDNYHERYKYVFDFISQALSHQRKEIREKVAKKIDKEMRGIIVGEGFMEPPKIRVLREIIEELS